MRGPPDVPTGLNVEDCKMIEIAGDADNDIRSMRQRLPVDVVRTSSARHRLDRSSPTAMRCLAAAAAVLMLFTASTPADTVSPEVPLRGALDVLPVVGRAPSRSSRTMGGS